EGRTRNQVVLCGLRTARPGLESCSTSTGTVTAYCLGDWAAAPPAPAKPAARRALLASRFGVEARRGTSGHQDRVARPHQDVGVERMALEQVAVPHAHHLRARIVR